MKGRRKKGLERRGTGACSRITQSSQVLRSTRDTSTRRAAQAPGSPFSLYVWVRRPALRRRHPPARSHALRRAPRLALLDVPLGHRHVERQISKSALSLVTRLGSALNSRTTSQQHLNISELGPKSQWRVRSSGTCHVLQCVAAPGATSALRLERVDQSLAVQGADRRRLHAQHGKRERKHDAQMAVEQEAVHDARGLHEGSTKGLGKV